MNKVVIFQHRLLHYRVELFEKIRTRCLENDIELCIVHGQPNHREKVRNDVGFLTWANSVDNWHFSLSNLDLIWLPFPAHVRDADLVVLMQENRQLSNYPILLRRLWSKWKVAYWGHGANFQSNSPEGLRERWKRYLRTRVDWWFAYTQITRSILLQDGYPNERISVLNNAIDNGKFRSDLAMVTSQELKVLRQHLGLQSISPVGLFCGSLYPEKRINYMVQAADLVRLVIPDFSLIVIGDGPSVSDVSAAAMSRPWLHRVGVKKGREKAVYFRLANVVFNPGAVGLHVLESFCAGVPMVTTADAKHGPEVAYLENGINGLMVQGDAEAYAKAVIDLLSNPAGYEQVRHAALVSAEQYSLDNMVEQFVSGMLHCLAKPRKTT